jgi:hypothetical protein
LLLDFCSPGLSSIPLLTRLPADVHSSKAGTIRRRNGGGGYGNAWDKDKKAVFKKGTIPKHFSR